jgi:hypothetical protein
MIINMRSSPQTPIGMHCFVGQQGRRGWTISWSVQETISMFCLAWTLLAAVKQEAPVDARMETICGQHED